MMKNTKRALLVLMSVLLVVASLVFAACQPNETKLYVHFVTNGATAIADVEVKVGDEYTLPVPERDGYEFNGWFATEDFSGAPVTKVTIEGNVTFYASWTKFYTITLDLAGGALGGSNTIRAKAGDDVSALVKSYVPTKDGYTFGAWFVGNTELANGTKLGESDMTLVAKYKVNYSAEVWIQNETLDGYTMAEVVPGSDYVGNKVNSSLSKEGFYEVENENAVTELTLKENAQENVFRHYFNRSEVEVIFHSNYPEGSGLTDEDVTIDTYYGVLTGLPYGKFEVNGYYLLGWALSPNGEAEYMSNYVYTNCYNASGEGKDGLYPDNDMEVYAVWVKGYTDLFLGEDFIYVLDKKGDEAYLIRKGIIFKGEYYPADKEFTFTKDGNIFLEGKLYDDTFSYYNVKRAERSYLLFVSGVGLDQSVSIFFDAYNGIRYVKKLEFGGSEESSGTYVIDEQGLYVVTYNDGPLAGETMVLTVGTAGNGIPVFQVRNEEEYQMGILVRFVTNNGTIAYLRAPYYSIILTGFGQAILFQDASNYQVYYYLYDAEEELLSIYDGNSRLQGIARILTFDFNGTTVKGYMLYTEENDTSYEVVGGGELKLDGLGRATYTNKNGKVTEGTYSLSSSVFGGMLITLTYRPYNLQPELYESIKFMVTVNTETVVSPETGESETITTYVTEEKLGAYGEYYYMDEKGVYYAPLFVLNDGKMNNAALYGFNTTTKKQHKISEGTYTYDDVTGLYTYTAVDYYEAEVSTSLFDIYNIKSCVFGTAEVSVGAYTGPINYWVQVTFKDDTTETFGETYTCADGTTLKLVGGMASYTADGKIITGTCAVNDSLVGLTYTEDNTTKGLYFEIDSENNTFIKLAFAPYSAFILHENGDVTRNEYIAFDGKGGAIYTIITTDENGEKVVITYKGKSEDTTEVSMTGAPVSKFVSEEKTVKYILLSTSSAVIAAPFNETYNGAYTAEDGSTLTLDGFGFVLRYVDKDGNELIGTAYSITEENVVSVTLNNQTRYFDLKADKKFTIRGLEARTYLFVDNQTFTGNYITLNGYDKLVMFTSDEDGERIYLDENGSYTLDGDDITVTYTLDGKTATVMAKVTTWVVGTRAYYAIIIKHDDVAKSYVNPNDWTVITLNSDGTAVKSDEQGMPIPGNYSLITDNLLYFVTDDETDACIYSFDTSLGIAIAKNFKARGYYTKELNSLLFSKYGFAIFNGETRHYYNVEGDNVIIYTKDATNPNANKYGYVAEEFGSFDATKEYKGKTYFANDGFDIKFNRIEDTKSYYPVTYKSAPCPLEGLFFTPGGAEEFAVNGTVVIGGDTLPCVVVRERVEDHLETYVVISLQLGYFRFDIDFEYNGESESGESRSTYEVTNLRRIINASSYQWLQMYMLGMMFGLQIPNEYGTVEIVFSYDIEGNISSQMVYFTFLSQIKIYDTNGKLITHVEAPLVIKDNGEFMVTFVGEDGYTYNIHFLLQQYSSINLFITRAFAREETLTEGEYTVKVETIIMSDAKSSTNVYSIALYKGEEEIPYDTILIKGGEFIYINRTYSDDEDAKVLSTTYYKIVLVAKSTSGVGEDKEEINGVPLFEKVSVTPETIQTVYSADGNSFVDIRDNDEVNEITLMVVNGDLYLVSSCEYDAETGTYTVKTTAGNVFTVKIEAGNAVISEVVANS